MLKTIKTKKQMRLDELIKYIFENDIKDKKFKANNHLIYPFKGGNNVTVNEDGAIYFGGLERNMLSKNDTFTVEIEEPITKVTLLEKAVYVHKNETLVKDYNTSIDEITRRHGDSVSEIHALINGRLELLWERDEDE